jgi:hypothetical protein
VTKQQNSDDTESEEELEVSSDPSKPWLWEWNLYLQMHEMVPKDMGIVRWWGVCQF